MKMNHCIKLLFWLAASSFCMISNASVIQTGNYNTINGLDWLDLSVTEGLSYTEAIDMNPDFRIANYSEYQEMYALFETVGDNRFITSNVTGEGVIDSSSGGFVVFQSSGDRSDWVNNFFTEVFGKTYFVEISPYTHVYSYGFYASGNIQRLGGVDAIDFTYSTATDQARTYQEYTPEITTDGKFGFIKDKVGWFLVRDASVPEPPVLALICLGLAGLVLTRRRRQ